MLIAVKVTQAKVYYVSIDGSDNNSGSTVVNSWESLSYAASAASPLIAGDTVYVKAADYGAENVVFEKSGVSNSPIVFIGYSFVPGDAGNINFKPGDNIQNIKLPNFDGGSRSTGTGFRIKDNTSYLIIKNFILTNYEAAFSAPYGTFITLTNVLTLNTGDINKTYSGNGIHFGTNSHYNTIENCTVINSSAEGISINGHFNTVRNCRIYCNENTTNDASTDYYLFVTGSYNKINNCYVERMGDLYHQGHGIGLKGNCNGNIFENCKAVNCSSNFYVRHRGVKNNTFRYCVAKKYGGFIIRDGASTNIFENCITEDCQSAIRFNDTSEDGGAVFCGRNNIIRNGIFINSEYGIDFNNYDQVSVCDSNLIVNSNFFKCKFLFACDRENNANKLINCIIRGVENLYGGNYNLRAEFSYCDFYSNNFQVPTGTGNISADPFWVNENNGNLHLKQGSACINAGLTTTVVQSDFDGEPRPYGGKFDIGAYEFNPTTFGVAEQTEEFSALKIFPNPSSGEITIDPGDVGQAHQLTLITILGEVIAEKRYNPGQPVHFTDLQKGIYLLVMDKKVAGKIMIGN